MPLIMKAPTNKKNAIRRIKGYLTGILQETATSFVKGLKPFCKLDFFYNIVYILSNKKPQQSGISFNRCVTLLWFFVAMKPVSPDGITFRTFTFAFP